MEFPNLLFLLFVLGLAIYFGINMIRRGSIKGAMFNAEIMGTAGEVETVGGSVMSQKIKVHRLSRNGQTLVGIEIVSKSIASYEMQPLVLTERQAAQLAGLLEGVGRPG